MWGQRRLNYLNHHRKVLYYNLLTFGKLHSHLANTEEQANNSFLRLVKQYAEKEGVTEQLKAADMLLWVQRMNNIRNRVTEIVNSDVVFLYSYRYLSSHIRPAITVGKICVSVFKKPIIFR